MEDNRSIIKLNFNPYNQLDNKVLYGTGILLLSLTVISYLKYFYRNKIILNFHLDNLSHGHPALIAIQLVKSQFSEGPAGINGFNYFM